MVKIGPCVRTYLRAGLRVEVDPGPDPHGLRAFLLDNNSCLDGWLHGGGGELFSFPPDTQQNGVDSSLYNAEPWTVLRLAAQQPAYAELDKNVDNQAHYFSTCSPQLSRVNQRCLHVNRSYVSIPLRELAGRWVRFRDDVALARFRVDSLHLKRQRWTLKRLYRRIRYEK